LSHLRLIQSGQFSRHHWPLHFCTNRAMISSFHEKFDSLGISRLSAYSYVSSSQVVHAVSLKCRLLGLNFGFRQLKLLTPQQWFLHLLHYRMSIRGLVLPLVYPFENGRVYGPCFFCRRINIMWLWPLYLLVPSRLIPHFPQYFCTGHLRCSRCTS
jgi:hypothetical protein